MLSMDVYLGGQIEGRESLLYSVSRALAYVYICSLVA